MDALEELGYSPFFAAGLAVPGLEGCVPARVTAGHKGGYTLAGAAGEFPGRLSGRALYDAAGPGGLPAVGDWVAAEPNPSGPAMVRALLPRRTLLRRATGEGAQIIAANVDTVFIVESCGRDFNLNRFERYLALASEGGADAALVLNKTDLASPDELAAMAAAVGARFPAVPFFPVSAAAGSGLDAVAAACGRGRTCCFLGSSGVGKSTLVNALLGGAAAATSGISEASGRGRHTTTSRQCYRLPSGGLLLDTPGLREVGVTGGADGTDGVFGDIEELAARCRFSDCLHAGEPGCAVAEALDKGLLDAARLENYRKLKREAEHYRMSAAERRAKDHRFGRMVKKILQDKKKERG